MIDVEPLIVTGLDRLVPLPGGERSDWQDVLQRAGVRTGRRRRIAFAFAAVVAALVAAITTPVGAAIAQGIGDFSAWLSGHPGKEAPASEQREFEAANGHSWASFPKGTQLRELIRADVGGERYVLSGFRSGNSLCLQLNGTTRRTKREPACAPASTLAHVSAPLLIVTGNSGFYDQSAHTSAVFSFGIVADGVKRVAVHANDGTHPALVGGNAYLWIEPEPNTGTRAESISVTGARGRTTSVSVPTFGLTFGARPSGRPGGPTGVQARIGHPKIGWFARHERRGLSVDEAKLTQEQRQGLDWCCRQARLFKPDPLSNVVVGIAPGGCLLVIGAGSGCSGSHFFFGTPVKFGTYALTGFNTSDQFLVVAGAAADGVRRIVIFLPDGQRQTAVLKDNMFTATIPGRYPFRVVGYDGKGRAVAIRTVPGGLFARSSAPAAARRELRPVWRVRGPNGATATLSVGHVVKKTRCWQIAYSAAHPQSGCQSQFFTGQKIWVKFVQPAGRDLFVFGEVDVRVTRRIELHFENGDVISTRPVAGHFVLAIPKAHLHRQRQFAYVLAVDPHRHRVQRQGIAFRTVR